MSGMQDAATRLVSCRCLGCQGHFSHRQEGAGLDALCPACGSVEVVGLQWFVVHTNRKAEAAADSRLRALGYRTFFPQYRTLVRHARKILPVVRAFLPRYLFVGLAEGQGLYGVNTCHGVATVVHSGGRPQRLPDSVVTEWVERMGPDGVIEVPSALDPKREKLESGQEVEIVDGPFAGFGGIVELDNGREVSLWVSLFGRRVKAQFYIEALSPVVRRHRG